MANGTDLALPIDESVLFSNHKEKKTNAIEKRQRKFLEKLDFLIPFLEDDEKVLLVTTGCSPMSLLEQFFTGSIVYYLKRSIFVFTNQRIFHIPTTARYAYRNSIAKIEYGDCASIAMKGRSLVVKYTTGKTEKFYFIAARERKKIKALISQLPLGKTGSPGEERTYLCPRCTSKLEEGAETCSRCRLEFKHRAQAWKISIVVPGGGYFYTRHWILGLMDAAFELYFIVILGLLLIAAVNGKTGLAPAIIVFAFIVFVEKIGTIYHSLNFLEDFLPVDSDIQVRPKTA